MGYLRLLNLPLLFTALGDVVAGYVVVTAVPCETRSAWVLMKLLVASGCLFGAGAVSRRCFEFEESRGPDAADRAAATPPRSGVPDLKGAFVLAAVLAVTGVLASMLIAKATVYLAWALLFTHWLHGGYLREYDVTGSVAVGVTRLFNIMMGMSAGAQFMYSLHPISLSRPAVLVPLREPELLLPCSILLVYAVLISIIGRLRTEGGTRFTLAAAGAGVLVTLIAAGVFYHTRSLFAVLLLLLVGAAVVIPLLGAVSRLSPRSIGRVVVVGTLAAVLLDASFIFGSPRTGNGSAVTILTGVFTMCLLLPAVVSWRLAPPPMAGELG